MTMIVEEVRKWERAAVSPSDRVVLESSVLNWLLMSERQFVRRVSSASY